MLISPNHDNSNFNFERPGDFIRYNYHEFPINGERIYVFWNFENEYFPGIAHFIDDKGKHIIHYDDDVVE